MENNTPANNQTPQQDVQSNSGIKGLLANRKIVLVILTALLLVIVGIIGFLVLRRGSSDQVKLPPEVEIPENVLLASVGEKQIWRDDVVKIALEQYASNAITSDVLKSSLENSIERTILDEEAAVLNLTVPQTSTRSIYYEDLKSEVMKRRLGTVTANLIMFWVPAFGDIYPQTPEYQEMRDLYPEIFAQAETEIRQGKKVYDIGKRILEEYPVYTEKLNVNSYLVSKVSDENLFANPVTYQYEVNDSNKVFLDFIFSLDVDDVEVLEWPDGEGAAIVQIVDKTEGDQISYADWLAEKKKGVKYEDENVSSL